MTYNTQLPEYLELEKATPVHLTANGEMCNRLARGTRIIPVRRKGDWVKISWRKGKKKGWIFFPNPSIKST
jgi:hypothetical protein